MNTKRSTIQSIVIFALLVNALAWLGPLLGGDPTNPGPGFLLWGVAPILSALVMKFLLRDKVSLGFRPNLRGNGRWYLLSLLLYPIAIGLVLAGGLLLKASSINSASIVEILTAMLPLAIIYFVFAFFEEVGWRGYLAPKVYGVYNGFVGHAIVGVIWASWHFPYMQQLWAHTAEPLAWLLPRFVLGTIVSTVVYGEIRIRTNSVWPAVIMHGVGNTLANGLLSGAAAGAGFVRLQAGREWLGSFGVEGALMMLIFALVGGLLYLKRGKHAYLATTATGIVAAERAK